MKAQVSGSVPAPLREEPQALPVGKASDNSCLAAS